jgi:hypothetical protein
MVNVMRRIAVPLGIAGGIIALGGSVLMAVTLPPGITGRALHYAYFGFAAIMAVAGLVAVALRIRRSLAARPLMWVAAVAIGMAGLVPDPFSFGLIYLPAALLLILSAIGLEPAP